MLQQEVQKQNMMNLQYKYCSSLQINLGAGADCSSHQRYLMHVKFSSFESQVCKARPYCPIFTESHNLSRRGHYCTKSRVRSRRGPGGVICCGRNRTGSSCYGLLDAHSVERSPCVGFRGSLTAFVSSKFRTTILEPNLGFEKEKQDKSFVT